MLPSPSRAALLDLLHPDPPSHDAAWFAAVDWDGVLACAGASLSPLVLRGIGARTSAVPPRILATLTERRDRMARTRLLAASVLGRAARGLSAASLPFIVLKGAALAVTVYPDPVLRPMSDIDLWVPPDRFDQAIAALEGCGFRDADPDTMAIAVSVERDHASLTTRASSVSVELHPNPASLKGLPWAGFDAAWRAGADADLGGFTARVLAPEHQLTHVALHLARKNLFASGLSHLADVAWIVRTRAGDWDWPRLVGTWRAQGIAEWMTLALVLARELLGAPVPRGIEAGVAGAQWPGMLALAESQLWEGRARRLPPAVERSAGLPASERRRWLRWRLLDYYWVAPVPRPVSRVLADGLLRLWHDLTVKVPKYVRGWLRGDLRGAVFAEGVTLARSRLELERLVAASQAGTPVSGGASAPDAGAAVATRPEQR